MCMDCFSNYISNRQDHFASVNKYLCATSAHPRHTFPGYSEKPDEQAA